ncbi:MAG TPA: hypothetical protein VJ644_07040 [Jiangellaceae bacterium]|nr:hypothetical protein [Jiangellaceae bacterium]
MSDQPDNARAHDQAMVPEVSRSEKRLEIFATALLALSALATAWSGYQASLWDGIQSSSYTQASAARTNASLRHTEANQFRLADLSVFSNFIDASVSGDTELADFYRTRFRDEFEPAYEAWIALDPLTNPAAPATPLAMPEYKLALEQEASDLTALAEAKFAEGEDANTFSDVYTASTLFFASALFFSAISERFEYRRARIALLAFACAGLIAGVAVALSQPITTG